MKTKLLIIVVCTFLANSAFAMELNESKVIELASKSLQAKQAEAEAEAALTAKGSVRSLYDTNLNVQGFYQVDQNDQTSPLFGDRADTAFGSISLNQHLPSGTDIGIGLSTERDKIDSNVAISGQPIFPGSAFYEPIFNLELRQPLVNNTFGYIDRRTIKQTDASSTAAEFQTFRARQEIIYQALANYWTAVFLRDHIKAINYQIRSARKFLRITSEKKKIGTADEADYLAAKANLLSSQGEMDAANASLANSEFALRKQLDLSPDSKIVVLDKKPTIYKLTDVSILIKQALENRPDFLASKKVFEQRNISLQMESNKVWPSLDLIASLNLNNIDDNFNNSFSGMNNPKYKVGLEFSFPLQNKYARYSKKKAKAERSRALFSLKQLENSISNEVARASVEHGKRLAQLKKGIELVSTQKRKLKVEMNKYASQGRSSAAVVSKYEQDLSSSQLQLVKSQISYEQARLDLLLAISAWKVGK